MRNTLPAITLSDLAVIGFDDLFAHSHMIDARWRTERNYAQRRITPRKDREGQAIKGWRVSHEKGAGEDRDRIQKSFYFATNEGFEQATAEAHQYRDALEVDQGLVAWRLKPVEVIENAFCIAGISLNIVEGRAPFWLLRDGKTRISSSIATHGLRGAYEEVARRSHGLNRNIILPILSADEAQALISAGFTTQQVLDQEAIQTYQWVRNFILKARSKGRQAA